MDIYSTVLDIAGLKVPENFTQDGESLTATLFKGVETDERYKLHDRTGTSWNGTRTSWY